MSWKKGEYKPQITKKSSRVSFHIGIVVDEVDERQKKNFSPGVEKVERITTQDLDSDLKRKVKK